jgi:mono/diheme cytochrome c family protein
MARLYPIALLSLLATAVGVTVQPGMAQDAVIGAAQFATDCAVCHGLNGKGHGVMAKILTVKPADLTVLASNNGGEYPFLRVFQTIDGRTQVQGHGDRDMPIWGDVFEADSDLPPGTYGSEQMVRARILELVYYVQSIQEK